MSAGVIAPPRPRTPRISRMGGEISKKCRRVFVSPPSRLARQRGHLPDISASRSDADCSMDDSNDLLEPIQAPEVSPNAPSRHNLRYRRIIHQGHVSDEREALKRSKLSRKGSNRNELSELTLVTHTPTPRTMRSLYRRPPRDGSGPSERAPAARCAKPPTASPSAAPLTSSATPYSPRRRLFQPPNGPRRTVTLRRSLET